MENTRQGGYGLKAGHKTHTGRPIHHSKSHAATTNTIFDSGHSGEKG